MKDGPEAGSFAGLTKRIVMILSHKTETDSDGVVLGRSISTMGLGETVNLGGLLNAGRD